MNPVDLDTACKYGSGCARAPLVVLEWMGLRPYPAFSPPPLAELAGVGVHVPCPAFNEGLSLHRFAVGGGSGFEGLSARQARHNRLGYLGCLGDVEDSPCSFQQPSSVICAGGTPVTMAGSPVPTMMVAASAKSARAKTRELACAIAAAINAIASCADKSPAKYRR